MLGLHQQENISVALKVCDVLRKKGFVIRGDSVHQGLKKTVWRGRGEYYKKQQTLIDGAHNPGGAKVLRNLIDTYFLNHSIIWVIATLNTKDSRSILKELIREKDTVIFTEPIAKNPAL